jgi:hypothetical protein
MAWVIDGWSLPNNGFKFRHNPPDGCRDMGVGIGVVAVYLVRLYFGWQIFVYVEMYCKKKGDFALAARPDTDKNYMCHGLYVSSFDQTLTFQSLAKWALANMNYYTNLTHAPGIVTNHAPL